MESAAARRLCSTVGILGGERGGATVAGLHRVAGGERSGAVMPNGVASMAGASGGERGAAASSGRRGWVVGRRAWRRGDAGQRGRSCPYITLLDTCEAD